MANADTPEDALTARKNGAQGIGLCRTEHMVIIILPHMAIWLHFQSYRLYLPNIFLTSSICLVHLVLCFG